MVRHYKIRTGKSGGRFYTRKGKKYYLKKGQKAPVIGKKVSRGRPQKAEAKRGSGGRISYYTPTGNPRGRPKKTGVTRGSGGRISRAKPGAQRGRPSMAKSGIPKTIMVGGSRYKMKSRHRSKRLAQKAAPRKHRILKKAGLWVLYIK